MPNITIRTKGSTKLDKSVQDIISDFEEKVKELQSYVDDLKGQIVNVADDAYDEGYAQGEEDNQSE